MATKTRKSINAGIACVLTMFAFAPPSAVAREAEPAYARVVGNLEAGGVPLRQLRAGGCVAVTPAAGRIVALAFSPDGENLLWTNPQIADPALLRSTPEKLVGGLGGDRLWFAPELEYHWHGVPNWNTFENYKTPSASDPGAYAFAPGSEDEIVLHAEGELKAHGNDRPVGYRVTRWIRLAQAPVAVAPFMKGVRFVGITTSHRVALTAATRTGRLGLWHLLQLPVGSVLVVPLQAAAPPAAAAPLSYGLRGTWEVLPDQVRWRYGGKANAKFGLGAAALTGRSAAFRRLSDGDWLMIVRDFPIDPRAVYCDHPHGVPRNDQALQAWDGYGFGEMEFHSPALDAEHGPRSRTEEDSIWAFAADRQAIAVLAKQLLGVRVDDLLLP
jgi:hypothetical protein